MKHKWHDVICAWARGERIQVRSIRSVHSGEWSEWTGWLAERSTPQFNNCEMEFRIAPKMRRVTLRGVLDRGRQHEATTMTDDAIRHAVLTGDDLND